MLNLSKQGNTIYILYGAKNYATGQTVVAEIYAEDNAKFGSDVTLTEIGTTGLYGGTYTPDATGQWKVKVKEGSTYRAHAYIEMADHDIISVGGDVTSIKNVVEHVTYGNEAIKNAIDAIPTTDYTSTLSTINGKLDTIDSVVDGNAVDLTAIKGTGFATGTDSLKAIKDYLVNTIQSSISGISNNVDTSVSIPSQMLRPTSSSTPFKIYVNIYDSNGNMEDPDVYAGYQELGLTGKTGATATGLSDTTQYYFKVNDDGNGVTEYDITTDGTAGVDFTELIGLLNTATSGVATWSLVNGDLRCTSDTVGAGSSIALSAGTTGTDLFANITGFTAFDTAVNGSDSAMVYVNVVDESGNDRNSNLTSLDASTLEGKNWLVRESVGRFSCAYSVSSAHDLEQLTFTFGYDENGASKLVDRATVVTDHVDLESDVDTILSEIQSATYGLSALKTLLNGYFEDGGSIEVRFDSIDSALSTIDTVVDGNASALTTIEGKIDTIDSVVDSNASALTTINGKIDIIDTVVDSNYSVLTNGTYGLSALKTLLDTITSYVDGVETDLTAIKGAGFNGTTDSLEALRDNQDAIKGATWNASTDSLEAIRDAIDTIDVGTGGYIN